MKTKWYTLLSLFIAIPVMLFYAYSSSPSKDRPTIGRKKQLAPMEKNYLIPEYFPINGVVVSDILFNDPFNGLNIGRAILNADAHLYIMAANLLHEKEQKTWLIDQGFTNDERERITILAIPHDSKWIRDYGPLHGYELDRDSLRLRLFDFQYESATSMEDIVAYQMGIFFRAAVEQIPLVLDGGNFLTDGKNCYISQPFQNLQNPYLEDTTYLNKYIYFLKRYMDCEEVVIFDDTPHEHLDMMAKIVDNNTVVVNELEQEVIDEFEKAHGYVPDSVYLVQEQLDLLAIAFSKYLKVIRLPMPIPYNTLFRTYANGLIVNKTILVPRYQKFGWERKPYKDQNLIGYFEARVKTIYESLGLKVVFVGSDELIYNGGSIHCVTLPLLANAPPLPFN